MARLSYQLTDQDRAQLVGDVARLEEQKRQVEEMRTRTFKRSELDGWIAQAMEAGDHEQIRRLALLQGEAHQQGRLIDDVTPTRANVRAKVGPTAWVLDAGEIPLIVALAKDLDSRYGKAIKGGMSYQDAAMKLFDRVHQAGGLAEAEGSHEQRRQPVGHAYQFARPPWLGQDFDGWARWQPGVPTDPRDVRINNEQVARWTALQNGWHAALDAVRQGKDLPPDRAAYHWSAIQDASEWTADHARSNRAAIAEAKPDIKRWAHEKHQELGQAARAAIEAKEGLEVVDALQAASMEFARMGLE